MVEKGFIVVEHDNIRRFDWNSSDVPSWAVVDFLAHVVDVDDVIKCDIPNWARCEFCEELPIQ